MMEHVLVLRLSNLAVDDLAEELSGQIEGDMLIDATEYATFNGRIQSSLRWRDNTVPYWINETFFGMNFRLHSSQFTPCELCFFL